MSAICRALVVLLAAEASAAPPLAGDAAAGATAPRYSPLVMSVLAEPHPVKGSDLRTHLVYELKLANSTRTAWPIGRIEVLDGDAPGRVLLSVDGAAVATVVAALGDRSGLRELGPGQSALAFLHVRFEPGEAVPRHLVHRLVLPIPASLPPVFAEAVGLPPGATTLEQVGAATAVAASPPAVLAPPLAGAGWIAADGCCTAARHVRSVQTYDGELFAAQRFAIDWERVDGEDRIYAGDPQAVESYFAYDQPLLAVADARVVRVLDGLEDQVPGALPPALPLAQADGNHVILDLGDGRFVLYAHLRPDTVAVSEGQHVRRGQLLGRVGNSGNSSAPHLHLHVMAAPWALAADGLPYVFSDYELRGRLPSTAAFEAAEASGEPVEILPVEHPGRHANDLPLDLSLVDFPELGSH